jgi:hypothetical protein
MTFAARSAAGAVCTSMEAERESYIPVHPNEFQLALERSLECDQQALDFVRLLKPSLARAIHQRLHENFKSLIDNYTFVDPDREANDGDLSASIASEVSISELVDQTEEFLLHANYHRLTPSQIYQALRSATAWGVKLRIRFSDYKRLRVYARGDTLGLRVARRWYRLFRKQEFSVPIYRQLAVVFQRQSPSDQLHLRMFKNIPHDDVDMLLPGSVKITWLDQGKIGIPTLWGFSMTVTRLARSMWIIALLGAVEIVRAVWMYIAVAIAACLYSVKVFFSYRHARNRQLLNIAQSLYFQTLSNNKGVLLRLQDEAEQQWLCQAMVLVYVLRTWQTRGTPLRPLDSIEALDRSCEELLDRLGLGRIDFDIDASIRLLIDAKVLLTPEQLDRNPENGVWEFAKG